MRRIGLLLHLVVFTNFIYAVGIFNDNPQIQSEEQIKQLLNQAKALRDSSYDTSTDIGRKAIELAKKQTRPRLKPSLINLKELHFSTKVYSTPLTITTTKQKRNFLRSMTA